MAVKAAKLVSGQACECPDITKSRVSLKRLHEAGCALAVKAATLVSFRTSQVTRIFTSYEDG
eukprot:11407037-Karenia_brevis.AAC.1